MVPVTHWERFQDNKQRVENNIQRSNGSHATYILIFDLANINKYAPRNKLLLMVRNVIYLLYSIYKVKSVKTSQSGLKSEAWDIELLPCSLPSLPAFSSRSTL